jgi:uncharacterized membrane protein
MGQTTQSIEVDVDVRTAYNQWTQFESFPNFMSGVEEVRQLDDTRTHWKTSVAGVTREFDATITEQVPDERVAWRSDDGTDQAGVVTFRQLDPLRTEVTVLMTIDPEGLAENVADKTGIIDRQVKGDLERFKTFIESRGQETGAWRGQV